MFVPSYEQLRARHLADARALSDEIIGRLSWSRDRILAEQTRQLRRIVADAQSSSRYYQDRLGSIEASRLELGDLPKLPVLTKNDVMSHWDDLVTDQRLTLNGANRHLQQLVSGQETNPYYLDEYYIAATGGSSGKRGVFLWDWETFAVMANLAFRMEMLKDRTNPSHRPKRTSIICAASIVHGSRFLYPIAMDPERSLQIIGANTPIQQMVEMLNEFQPDRLIGYSSLVEELCAEARAGNLKIVPERVSVNSEPLTEKARQLALEVWDTNIHNQWGCVEIGLAASEGESFSGLTMCEDYLIFEPVGQNREAIAGNRADRLLITKLYGTVMPMIRYEVTDAVVIDDSPNPDFAGYQRIVDIKGRSDNWFVYTDGIRIHPMNFRGVLGQEVNISEYQVQQTKDGAKVLVIAHGTVSNERIARALEGALESAGLKSPAVTVEVVDDLPRHPETNKLKRFVRLSDT